MVIYLFCFFQFRLRSYNAIFGILFQTCKKKIHFSLTTRIFFLCVSTFFGACFALLPSFFFYNILKQETEIKSIYFLLFLQVDLRHMCEIEGSNVVDLGIDLSEMYLSVEWDILEVPAVR